MILFSIRFSVDGILAVIFRQESKHEMDMGSKLRYPGFADTDVQHWSRRTLVVWSW